MKDNNNNNNKTPLTHYLWAKAVSFFLAITMFVVALVSFVGAYFMIEEDVYSTPKEVALNDCFRGKAAEDCHWVLYNLTSNLQNEKSNLQNIKNFCKTNNLDVTFKSSTTDYVIWKYDGNTSQSDIEYTYKFDNMYMNSSQEEYAYCYVTLTVDPNYSNNYTSMYKFINLIYSLKYWIYVIGALALILSIANLIFLICAAGHKKGHLALQKGWGTAIPLDLLTGCMCVGGASIFIFLDSVDFYNSMFSIILMSLSIIILFSAVLGFVMSFSLRIKLGKWWKNTIIYYALALLYKLLRCIKKPLKIGFHKFAVLASKLPLIWKYMIAFLGVSIIEAVFMLFSWGEYDNLMIYWFIKTIILGAVVCIISLILRDLQKAGEELSNGNVDYKVDTQKLFGNFKKHGEALNSISAGINRAVYERMKSERMKTELITNVSHDIKTPLTSIINYTDLISKEECSNEKIGEYTQVLLRQSEKLKKLIDDLVEASKASTGNLEVNLSPCDINIFLSQVVGEYTERLNRHNLTLVTSDSNTPIEIMADGRRLWRVIDNLMSNVCKYSLENTRVYVCVECKNDIAVITIKNTSKEALNISEDELMERFVRGDSSRNTEGNGLGLSIARSLTELQGGNMEVKIDGDLFKVMLKFPI